MTTTTNTSTAQAERDAAYVDAFAHLENTLIDAEVAYLQALTEYATAKALLDVKFESAR